MARLPLDGVRIVDLTVVWAGPYATFLLAHLGAEVIRVEPTRRFQPLTRGIRARPTPEQVRQGRPPWLWAYPNRDPGERPWNRFGMFNAHAVNKKSITLNLQDPLGKEMLGRLVRISDVVIENNATDTMEELGVTYDWLRSQKEDIIFVRMPALGNTGKYRYYRQLGSMNEDVCGHNSLRGYADMDPTALSPVYAADAASGTIAAFAVLTALHYRNRTGKGQLIELAQVECFLPYLTQAYMDYFMNGRVQGTLGNRHPWAIQGCYPCKGEDRWVVITLYNDAQFERFCHAVGHPEWLQDPRFADALNRYRHHDDLDALISEWTRQRDPYEVFHTLQQAGVPAGPVMDQRDVFNDPHVAARNLLQEAYQEDVGTYRYCRAPWLMSETPPSVRRGPVRLGQDNEYVYRELLKVSDQEWEELVRLGHISDSYHPSIP